MDLTMLSATLLLLVLLDPIGNIPMFIATVDRVHQRKRVRVIFRECLIGYIILIFFTLAGNRFMNWLQLTDTALGIAGGVILFIIALRMIFKRPDGVFGDSVDGDPFIFPLAVPLFAGPSAIAFVLLITSKAPDRIGEWLLAVTLASAISSVVLSLSSKFDRFIGRRGIQALETMFGLLLTAVATQMLLDGIRQYLKTLG